MKWLLLLALLGCKSLKSECAEKGGRYVRDNPHQVPFLYCGMWTDKGACGLWLSSSHTEWDERCEYAEEPPK